MNKGIILLIIGTVVLLQTAAGEDENIWTWMGTEFSQGLTPTPLGSDPPPGGRSLYGGLKSARLRFTSSAATGLYSQTAYRFYLAGEKAVPAAEIDGVVSAALGPGWRLRVSPKGSLYAAAALMVDTRFFGSLNSGEWAAILMPGVLAETGARITLFDGLIFQTGVAASAAPWAIGAISFPGIIRIHFYAALGR